MQRRYLVIAAVIAAVGLVVWWRGRGGEPVSRAAEPGRGSPAGPARAAGDPGAGEPPAPRGAPGHVRRLAAEERRRLGEQIAAARRRAREAAARATGPAGAAPAEDATIPLEQVAQPLKDALQESIAILAECYREQPGGDSLRTAAALMTMTSDPELGTVIDTGRINDAGGRPLALELEECLRDTIDSLALPPLGAGGKLQLQYTFKLD